MFDGRTTVNGFVLQAEAAVKVRAVATLLLLTIAGTALAAADKPTGPYPNLKFRNLGPAVSG
jgi:hypothetical protein